MGIPTLLLSYTFLSGLFLIAGVIMPPKLIKRNLMHIEYVKITFLIILLTVCYKYILYMHRHEIYDKLVDYLLFKPLPLVNVFITNTVLFSYVIVTYIYTLNFDVIIDKLKNIFKSYRIFKTLVLAPIIEELYFRLLFLLIMHINSFDSRLYYCLTSSLFFALSHLSLLSINAMLTQFTMTFIFGLYSSYILIVTESLWPVVLLHFYCNLLGPPQSIPKSIDKKSKRTLQMILFSSIPVFFAILMHF